ncbi:MAG TPA: polyprenol phosphomannose-dependent alpha 1,6 mannosyltransferase MptB [Polyangia bacterium]|nr:polyprenol phosphomannose-dependent alpha 1,6 mannosyltransferase MptB [Polyangia bacterium]
MVVGFNLLYLFVPAGWQPFHGFASNIAAAYAGWLPLPNVAMTPGQFARTSVAMQVGMWGAFLAAFALARKISDGPQSAAAFRLVAIGAAAICAALILTPPALSPDLYQFALFGRMVIARGLNPYVTPGDAMAGDPLFPLAAWHQISNHYGPVLVDLCVATAWFGAGKPIATAVAFKALAAASVALTGWAAASLARQENRDGLLPLMLVTWNPLALLETAGSAHNELIMIGLALCGVLQWRRGRTTLGLMLLVVSIHVKWITAALAGLVVIAHVRDIAGARARGLALAKFAAIAVAVTAAVYLPFWTGWRSLSATWGILSASHPEISKAGAVSVVNVILFAATAVIAAAVVARRGRPVVLEMAAVVSLAFVTFIFPWIFPWYLLPAAGLLAVGPIRRLNGSLLVITTAASMFLMAFWAVLVPR